MSHRYQMLQQGRLTILSVFQTSRHCWVHSGRFSTCLHRRQLLIVKCRTGDYLPADSVTRTSCISCLIMLITIAFASCSTSFQPVLWTLSVSQLTIEAFIKKRFHLRCRLLVSCSYSTFSCLCVALELLGLWHLKLCIVLQFVAQLCVGDVTVKW